MQNLINDSIQELLNHNDFKQRNLLLTNSNLIPLDYKSVCISSDEYSKIVDHIYNQCYQNGNAVSKNIVRARLNNILLDITSFVLRIFLHPMQPCNHSPQRSQLVCIRDQQHLQLQIPLLYLFEWQIDHWNHLELCN